MRLSELKILSKWSKWAELYGTIKYKKSTDNLYMLLIPLIMSIFQNQPLSVTSEHYPPCNTLLWEKAMPRAALNSDYKAKNNCQHVLKLLFFLGETRSTKQVGQQSKMLTQTATTVSKVKYVPLHIYPMREHQHKLNCLNQWTDLKQKSYTEKTSTLVSVFSCLICFGKG